MGRTLRQSLELIEGASAPASATGPAGLELLADWEAFGKYKVNRTGQFKASTWLVDYCKTANRLQVVAAKAVDAKSLLILAGEAWSPVSRWLQVVLQYLSAMCRWAVEADLLPHDRWTSPPILKSYVGEKLPAVWTVFPLVTNKFSP